jgi:TATA-binding protein-associated factor
MVIFLELDYNPFADLQAMDRAHRIGQSKVVNVYRIVTTASIEEQILKLQEKKVATSDAIVNTDNSAMFSMGTDRLLDIFTSTNTEDDLAQGLEADRLLERYAEDYATLSIENFTRSLVRRENLDREEDDSP